jgi:hypothetical protein
VRSLWGEVDVAGFERVAGEAPPASPPTLAGIFKPEGNSLEESTNLVSPNVRT